MKGKRGEGGKGEELSPLHWGSVQPAFDDSLSKWLKEWVGQGLHWTCAGTQKAEATEAKRMAASDSDPFYFVKKRK